MSTRVVSKLLLQSFCGASTLLTSYKGLCVVRVAVVAVVSVVAAIGVVAIVVIVGSVNVEVVVIVFVCAVGVGLNVLRALLSSPSNH